ncbi:MAG: DUF4136 domain-containing protein [Bacteroidota bacterium]|nr:DUF4136 domain-containing protein [Bacteroidota bacterium]
MKRKIISLLILSLIFLSACGPSVRIYSDIDDSAAFDQYATYNFMDFSEGNKQTITGMELERIRVAFARELEGRGLTFAEKNADVSIKIVVYHREAAKAYGYSGVYHHLERAISIDMFDNLSRAHVWHCAAVGELELDPEARAAELSELVARIFERYPVQAATES